MEDLLLCESATDEYLPRWEHLQADAEPMLEQLGWQVVAGADATLWAGADTAAEAMELADLLTATLVGVYAHPADDKPSVVGFP